MGQFGILGKKLGLVKLAFVGLREVGDKWGGGSRPEFYESGTRRRTGERTFVAEQIDKESLGFKTLSKSAIPIVRSRSINFTATGLRPFTRVYVFFDGKDVNAHVTPDSDSTTDATPVVKSIDR